MTPEQLERDIAHWFAESDRLFQESKRCDGRTANAADRRRWSIQAALVAGSLVAQRTPETMALWRSPREFYVDRACRLLAGTKKPGGCRADS